MRMKFGFSVITLVTLAGVSVQASAQDVLYGVTDTSLVKIRMDNPSEVQVVGQHGLAFTDLGNGKTLGAFSLTYDRGTDQLLGLYYAQDIATGIWDQFLVEYDQTTGDASIVDLIASSDFNGYVEAIEYVDGLGSVIVSRALAGSITTSLDLLNGDGTTTPLIDNGRDNDYAAYDQTRDRFYVTDPNGIGRLSHVDLGNGITTDLGPIHSHTGDLAYSAELDLILAYEVGTDSLVSLGNGLTAQAPEVIGFVGIPGVIQGLAVVSEGGGAVPCPADLNGDGYITNEDIWEFIHLFLSGDLRVDFTGNGWLGFDDIITFIHAFLEGC